MRSKWSICISSAAYLVCGSASAQTWNWGNEPWDNLREDITSIYAGPVAGVQLSDDGAGAFDHDPGYVLGGQFGVTFAPWRLESEVVYQRTDYDDAVDNTFDLQAIRGTLGLY